MRSGAKAPREVYMFESKKRFQTFFPDEVEVGRQQKNQPRKGNV
jgi:hypothetical protein